MPLTPGQRLGPYEIVAPLGAGGMGEVYKAKDTRLDRTVAIKILPPALAADPDFRARFEREAKTISQLAHPNICTLFDVGRLRVEGATASQADDEVSYIVMEHLEGETLADRLAKGPLPLADALRTGVEIAGALDRAHRQGIIHRDLKPGNVMLTKSGSKLLDFGLAKAGVTSSVAGAAPTALATSPLPSKYSPVLTVQGTILGTFQYMSPEQVEGEEADARADIFAFGAVLFEMITGQRAFSGKTQASLLAAILERETPSISQLVPVAPPALDYLVRTCLAKDPDSRFQTAHDVLLQLKWIAGEGAAPGPVSTVLTQSPVAKPTVGRTGLPWAIAIASLIIAAVSLLFVFSRTDAPAPPIRRLTIPTNVDKAIAYVFNENGGLALSRDGETMVFRAGPTAGASRLYQRRLDQFEATVLPGTEAPYGAFFSPANDSVAFGSSGMLRRVSTRGGGAVNICPLGAGVSPMRGGAWSEDDTIYFGSTAGPIMRVPSAGGTPEAATTVRKEERSHRWPDVLPGGRAILYTAWIGTVDVAVVYAESLDTHERQLVVRGASDGRYVASGHVIFWRLSGLYAIPFDAKTLKPTGPERPVMQNVFGSTASGRGTFGVSASGTTLVYEGNGGGAADSTLVWVDRKGVETPARTQRGSYAWPRLSPDGKQIAVEIADNTGSAQIWVLDPAHDTIARRTFEGTNGWPVWSPDGAMLFYSGTRPDGTTNIYRRRADGSGIEERLTTDSDHIQWSNGVSGDGKVLSIEEAGGGLSYLSLDAQPARHSLLENTSWNKDSPVLSWDGKWLAYASGESGDMEIVVQPFPSLDGKYVISTEGGWLPRWSRDGRQLFYWAPPGKIMAVAISTSPAVTWTKPAVVYEGPAGDFDVAADGSRIIVVKESGQNRSTPFFSVIMSWTQELAGKK